MRKRVVITGYSVINDMGKNRQQVEEGIFGGKSGVSMQDFEFGDGITTGPYGVVADLDEVDPFFEQEGIPYDRCSQLALMAAADCVRESGLDIAKEDPFRMGVSIGTSLGGMRSGDEFHKQWISKGLAEADPSYLNQYPLHAVCDIVAKAHGFRGLKNIISTACSASGTSLGVAYDYILNGSHDAFIAGGVDPMSRFSFAGFTALKAIDKNFCRPYSASTGINPAEVAAFSMLEEYEHAKARGATIYGEFLGYGNSADAYHQTAPEPSGGGALRAMKAALAMSGLDLSQVSYINGHGTGTHANDAGESNAVATFLGDRVAEVPLSSTKGATGHCLGAAGSVECAISVMALNRDELPPTVRFDESAKPIYTKGLNYIPNRAIKKTADVIMSNSFAFGGSNACIVVGMESVPRKAPEPKRERIVITGMGATGSGGMSVDELFETFKNRIHTEKDIDIEGVVKTKTTHIDDPDWKKYVPLKFIRRTDDITKYTMAAGREAMTSAKLTVTKANMDRIGVLYGTATGPMDTIEAISRAFITKGITAVDPSAFPNTVLNQAPGNFSIAYMLKGPTSTIAMSGTAELVAFQYACELLNNDQADAIVVIGADEVNDPLFAGYGKAGFLTTNGAPVHSKESDGMTLAEGAAAFVIEKESHAKERGARILATVLAGSCASDNCGISKVSEDGSGLKHCITEGLKQAAIEAPDLYVCGTPGVHYADDMEARVVNELFDEKTALTAPQALVGTTLGASGGYGILSALYAFEKGEVCGMPDGDYNVGGGLENRLVKENRAKDVKTAFVSTVGFGGAYAGIVLGKGEYEQ